MGEPVPAVRPARSDREVLNEELGIARIADETGFDSLWTMEHRFTPDTIITNPLRHLSSVAGITQRVDRGTLITLLPWRNPVRVAEGVNRLDAFQGPDREIICAVGRGLGQRKCDGLGIDQAQARERFDELLQVLRRLLATGFCDFQGRFYNIHNVRLRPQLERDLSANLWCAGGTDETVEIIARHTLHPLVIPTASLGLSLQTAQKYAQLQQQAGYAPSRTRLALWTHVADSETDPRRNAERHMVEYADAALHHYELRGMHLGNIQGYESYGAMPAALQAEPTPFLRGFFDQHLWGTLDKVIRRATERAEAFGTEEIMFIFKYGSVPMDVAAKSIRLCAAEALPALQVRNPQPRHASRPHERRRRFARRRGPR